MEDTYRISSNTQFTFGDLRIGAANFWEDEYVDEQGMTKRGPTAGLWIFVRDDPSQDQVVQVHVGQELTFSQYRIRVVEIGHEGGNFVRVAISIVDEPEN